MPTSLRTHVTVLCSGVAMLLSACSSAAYRSLRPEKDIPQVSGLLAGTRTAGNETFRVPVTTQGRTVGLAVHQVGNGQRKRALVFVHGVFSDHETWRFIAGELSRDYDLYLVDLPGCGDSEMVEPSACPPGFLAPQNLAVLVLQAVEEIVRRRGDRPQIALIGHSLGGTIILILSSLPPTA